ncbi:MAG TPA: alpha/beta hydrolase [Rhodospirillales bacterium]|nr:alpha/beta hydrolase [Rhodospirillales bacterium]
MIFRHFDLENIETNGVTLRAAVHGDGPLVILVHGWPELWYTWRHQIGPLAEAGYRVVAPDMRGYGGSDKPHEVEAYDMASLMADVVGIIDAFGEQTAILIGHDWGAPICWNTATLHAERVSAVAGLSVPHGKRGPGPVIDLWRQIYHDKFFYQIYFQPEGVAGAKDMVRNFVPGHDSYKNAAAHCSDLRVNLVLDGIGHWVQQEAPDRVNQALLEFLASL